MSYEKILLTTDGSEESEKALKHAKELAESCNAELHILYVVDIGVNTSYNVVEELMSQLESNSKLENIGHKSTEKLAEDAREAGIEVITAVEKGLPHRKILEYAEDNGVDVVVMSTHGRSGLDRMLLGSVTEKVLRKSKIPILTVTRDN